MSLGDRFFARNRIRAARRALAQNGSVKNYVTLANEYLRKGRMPEVERVCNEGLGVYPGNPELVRLADRARELEAADRARELYNELREAPRPALYHELCDLLLESGRLDRVEEVAQEWYGSTRDPQAQCMRAKARLERFYTDRRRDDARLAIELLNSVDALAPEITESLELQLELASRVGAWSEARGLAARMLQSEPGDPLLEEQYRKYSELADNSPTLDQALRTVEKTGALVDEYDPSPGKASSGTIRPILKQLVSAPGAKVALYVRGSTALVQGQRGPTAERTARMVREVVHCTRTAGRRMGFGQVHELAIEGKFGHFLLAPGPLAASAIWSTSPVGTEQHETMLELNGAGEHREDAA